MFRQHEKSVSQDRALPEVVFRMSLSDRKVLLAKTLCVAMELLIDPHRTFAVAAVDGTASAVARNQVTVDT